MEKVSQDKYLGGIISDKCDNKKKVENAKSKGLTAISSIMAILREVSFGHHYFDIAMSLFNVHDQMIKHSYIYQHDQCGIVNTLVNDPVIRTLTEGQQSKDSGPSLYRRSSSLCR